MAQSDVGKKKTFHSHYGDAPCWVVEYEAGREGGDHFIAGFSTPGMKTESGDTFSRWAQFGPDESQFD